MLPPNKSKPKRGLSCAIQNGAVSTKVVDNHTHGIHFLQKMSNDKAKASFKKSSCGSKNNSIRNKRPTQPVQAIMKNAPMEDIQPNPKIIINPEEATPQPLIKPELNGNKSDLNIKTIMEYGPDIDADLGSAESQIDVGGCLQNHSITPFLRGKMVNWMVEVLRTFECEDTTFLMAVNIMDLYYANASKMLTADDVHLAGIVSMFIASKYIEYIPFKLKQVQKKIAHGAFSPEVIKAKEREMMRTIKFNLTFATVNQYIEHYIEMFKFNKQGTLMPAQEKALAKFRNHCIYFTKMAYHDYHFLEYSYFFYDFLL